MAGLNNIELITDRSLEVNLKEMYECKRKYPKHAVIASLMVESKKEALRFTEISTLLICIIGGAMKKLFRRRLATRFSLV